MNNILVGVLIFLSAGTLAFASDDYNVCEQGIEVLTCTQNRKGEYQDRLARKEIKKITVCGLDGNKNSFNLMVDGGNGEIRTLKAKRVQAKGMSTKYSAEDSVNDQVITIQSRTGGGGKDWIGEVQGDGVESLVSIACERR